MCNGRNPMPTNHHCVMRKSHQISMHEPYFILFQRRPRIKSIFIGVNSECHTQYVEWSRASDIPWQQTVKRVAVLIKNRRNAKVWKQPWKSNTTHQSLNSTYQWTLRFERVSQTCQSRFRSMEEKAFSSVCRWEYRISRIWNENQNSKKNMQIPIGNSLLDIIDINNMRFSIESTSHGFFDSFLIYFSSHFPIWKE